MSQIGRKICLQTAFGTECPTQLMVLSETFAQIVSCDNFVSAKFRQDRMSATFECNQNWIGDSTNLTRMLAGGLIPYPRLGDNVCRVETTYRYLYREVWFGLRGQEVLFSKLNVASEISCNPSEGDSFCLILVEFGKFYWEEAPELQIVIPD